MKEAALRNGSLLQLGRVGLRFELSGETNKLQLSDAPEVRLAWWEARCTPG